MPKLVFISSDGSARTVTGNLDDSVMRAALDNDVPGIDGDCGGCCACGTCHVFIDHRWLAKVGSPGEVEESMLSFSDMVTPYSRLACQIQLTADLDGLIVHVPEHQH